MMFSNTVIGVSHSVKNEEDALVNSGVFLIVIDAFLRRIIKKGLR